MRILFATNPALGHLLPLVPLAQAARDAGHDVLVIGGASLADATRDAGLLHVVSGPPDLPSVFAQVPERQGLTGRRLAAATWKGAFAGVMAQAMAAGTLALANSWRPDLVVHEDSEQGSWIAAERLGMPHIALQATAWRGTGLRLSSEPLNRLLRLHGLPEDSELRAWHRYGFLTSRPPSLHNVDDPVPAGATPIRPTAPDATGGEPAVWPTAAGEGRPRVVVTMGTLMPGRTEAMVTILDELETLDLDIVATVGHDIDPAALGSRRPATRIARYVPMTPLLVGASLLVFHGGSGTMLAGLAAGVPLVVLPIAADQPENADRCRDAGVARVLDAEARATGDVRTAAAEVLGDPAYAAAAARVRSEIAAMPVPAALVPDLERLANAGPDGVR
jgi:UDP:flavonoid glycosyltransferase YjiC (YdhE family)